MIRETKYDYNEELDILHIYTSDIERGIKGCLSYDNFNIDIGEDDKVIGIEIEGASSLLNMSEASLSSLDDVKIIVKKAGNILFIGFSVIKKEQKSTIQFSVPLQKPAVMTAN